MSEIVDALHLEPKQATKRCLDALLAHKRTTNMPHPKEAGMRVVGWVLPQEIAGLSCAGFAIEELIKLAIAGSEVPEELANEFHRLHRLRRAAAEALETIAQQAAAVAHMLKE